jgi:hypothetical protein
MLMLLLLLLLLLLLALVLLALVLVLVVLHAVAAVRRLHNPEYAAAAGVDDAAAVDAAVDADVARSLELE